MTTHNLTYIRRATVRRDGFEGRLYHHDFGTGWAPIIFPTQQAAQRWLDAVNRSTEMYNAQSPVRKEG